MEIEKKLKEARLNSGLTQEQAAKKILVSRQTISNWENGKSLPDIISIMNMSDLYQISLDELLKGDQEMREKIEKEAKNSKKNSRVLEVTGILVVIVTTIYLISLFAVFEGSAFRDFCEGAITWVLIGIGAACGVTYISQKD